MGARARGRAQKVETAGEIRSVPGFPILYTPGSLLTCTDTEESGAICDTCLHFSSMLFKVVAPNLAFYWLHLFRKHKLNIISIRSFDFA